LTTDETWDELFDELYLRTYADHEPGDPVAEAHAAAALAGVEPPAELLDAPCGYGRHSTALAEAGFRVTGADRSPVLLDEGRRRSGEREWPRWVQADHRELPFEDGSFDAVLNLFSSLGYRGEEGDRATLAEFRRVLRPGGALVIETQHRDRIMSIFRERDWEERGDDTRLEKRRFDYVAGEIETEHGLLTGDGKRHQLTYRMRLYTATELARLVSDAGFATVECFGGFGREPLSRDTRLIVRAGLAPAPDRA
jgi:ubiquinone/menaquinone biosynthesis C-methylase UbiE